MEWFTIPPIYKVKVLLILFQLQTVKQRANKTECCLQTYFYMHDVCLKF